MIKILFLINTLGAGGAERVLVNLVNRLDARKYDITVETMFGDGVNASLLQPHVHYISKHAPCPSGIAYLFRLFSAKQLYRFFIGSEQYDILVAYMHGAPVKVISGCADPNVKKVTWLHNGNPETGSFFRFWFRKKKAFHAYASCDTLVAVSNSVAHAFSEYTGIQTVQTIYNTMDVDRIRRLAKKEITFKRKASSIYLLFVGRLSPEKGVDRFFRICKQLKMEGFPVEAIAVGTGEMKNQIMELVREQHAESWFHTLGFQENPYAYYSIADLFVCASYQEGLSTATIEALILGVPAVSTDVSGAREILGQNNEYGVVTENQEQALYEGIRRLLSDPSRLQHYRAQAAKRAAFFEPEKTVAAAQDLMQRVFNHQSR